MGRTAATTTAAVAAAADAGPRQTTRRAARAGSELAQGPAVTRSDAMRLAAEVERLQAELVAARATMAELAAKADVDPLLDIFNRRGFARELDRALAYVRRYGNPAALIYLDLDGFKPVNDRHGHGAGDAVLKAVAATLAANVRASDTVARLGGDEFAVLLWNLDAEAAAAKAAALEDRIAATRVLVATATLTVGASAGVAMLGASDAAPDVLARADRAMYARKAARRRR